MIAAWAAVRSHDGAPLVEIACHPTHPRTAARKAQCPAVPDAGAYLAVRRMRVGGVARPFRVRGDGLGACGG